jgi:6-phosphogluconolactonase/glucosamine-6-phosphate isomerase/deaminase
MNELQHFLTQHAITNHANQGITVCPVADLSAGVTLAKEMLSAIVDKQSVMYLSGGSMQALYQELGQEEIILPGAVGLIDERFGPPVHGNSNEQMVQKTGFLRYLQMRDVPFYSVLRQGSDRVAAASAYDERVRGLQSTYQKHIGLIGIGPDGHISSIIPNRPDFHNPWFDDDQKSLLVSEFDDPKSHYKERVGMTFLGLSMLDVLLVLAFGEGKKKMFEQLFEDGSEEDLPARFFKRPEIAEKTVLITDQAI